MILYRGDNIFNKYTQPYIYRNNGLRSKAFFGNQDPHNIERIGLFKTIINHINADDKYGKMYYDATDFLSFSESRAKALEWCAGKNRLLLEEAKDYEETRYLFSMNIEESKITSIGNGIYIYSYCCNPKLKKADSNNPIHSTVIVFQSQEEICHLCENIHELHHIVLINAVQYLQHYPEQAATEKALYNSKNDKEWLILPLDYEKGFRLTRIPRADFWNVELFKGIGEKRPHLNVI